VLEGQPPLIGQGCVLKRQDAGLLYITASQFYWETRNDALCKNAIKEECNLFLSDCVGSSVGQVCLVGIEDNVLGISK
jgi:hypothetical protein